MEKQTGLEGSCEGVIIVFDELDELGHALIILLLVGLGVGSIVLAWIFILGPAFNNAEYQQYQTSPTHINAVVSHIQNDCNQQLPGTTGPVKLAIERDIVNQAGSIDLAQPHTGLTSDDLTCIATAKQDITGGLHP